MSNYTLMSDPEVRQGVLDAAAETRSLKGAAAAVGMSRKTITRYRRDHPEFAEALALALTGRRIALPGDYMPDADLPPAHGIAKPKPPPAPRYVPATYSTLLRQAPESPRKHLARLARIADDPEESAKLRARALDALNKFYLGPLLQERSVMAERVGQSVDVSARARELEAESGVDTPAPEDGDDSAQAGPLVFAAIPANGSEAPGHGPADVIDIELAPGEAS